MMKKSLILVTFIVIFFVGALCSKDNTAGKQCTDNLTKARGLFFRLSPILREALLAKMEEYMLMLFPTIPAEVIQDFVKKFGDPGVKNEEICDIIINVFLKEWERQGQCAAICIQNYMPKLEDWIAMVLKCKKDKYCYQRELTKYVDRCTDCINKCLQV